MRETKVIDLPRIQNRPAIIVEFLRSRRRLPWQLWSIFVICVTCFRCVPSQGDDIGLEYHLDPKITYHYKGTIHCNTTSLKDRADVRFRHADIVATIPIHLTVRAEAPRNLTRAFQVAADIDMNTLQANSFKKKNFKVTRILDFSRSKFRTDQWVYEREEMDSMILRPWVAVLPNLPAKPSRSWQVWQTCRYTGVVKENMRDLFTGGTREAIREIEEQAFEQFQYELSDVNSEMAQVQFDYKGTLPKDAKNKTTFQSSGKGSYIFDRKMGLVLKFKMKGEYTVGGSEKSLSDSVAISLEYDPNYVAGEFADRRLFRQPNYTELSDAECERWIERFKSSTKGDQRDAAFAFFCHAPNKAKNKLVVKLMQDAFETLGPSEKYWCASAIGRWGNDDVRPFLLNLLLRKDQAAIHGAIAGLAFHPCNESALGVLNLLDDEKYLLPITRAMQAMDSVGEANLLAQLKPEEPKRCCNACKILSLTGSRHALLDLEVLEGHQNEELAHEAKAAIASIKKRNK